MNWQALCRRGAEVLAAAGIVPAQAEARLLLLGLFDMELAVYARICQEEVSGEDVSRYEDALRERAGRRPLQYITHRADFYGRTFYVDERVLIPRFDTETLAGAVLERTGPGMRVLEIGTGSGAVLATILLEQPGIFAAGTDVSEEALAVTGKNLAAYGLTAELYHGDLFDGVPGRFDLIYSNPPYIPSAGIEDLMPEVRIYEPGGALDGGEDGLVYYRRISRGAPEHLAPGGRLLFEIGKGQEDAVAGYLADAGFCDIVKIRDLNGIIRVVGGQYAGAAAPPYGEENV